MSNYFKTAAKRFLYLCFVALGFLIVGLSYPLSPILYVLTGLKPSQFANILASIEIKYFKEL